MDVIHKISHYEVEMGIGTKIVSDVLEKQLHLQFHEKEDLNNKKVTFVF